MLPGFNHNIKYQDRVYHIQTEDSGVRLAHVTSLLFIGGNVIATTKTEYGELRDAPDLSARVLQIMQTQHKAMLRALVSGRYDAEIAARSHNAATLDGPAPINIEAGAQNRASQIVTPLGISAPASAPPAAGHTSHAKPAASAGKAKMAGSAATAGQIDHAAGAPSQPHASTTRPSGAKAEPSSPTSGKGSPTNKTASGKKAEPKEKKSGSGEPNIEALAPMLMQPAGSLPTMEKSTASKQRGAPPRAANQSTSNAGLGISSPTDVIEGEQLRHAFAQNEKAVDESIFGNLISPKSLDEVILSYLANNKSSDK